MTRLHLILLCCVCLLLVGCGAEGEMVAEAGITPTQLPVTGTPMETAVSPTFTPLPATETAVPTDTATLNPTDVPTKTPIPLPPPPGEIVFLWSPEPEDFYAPQPQNLYFAKPGNSAGEWEMETALTDLHGSELYLSPDNTKFAIRLFEDTNEDGNISVQGTDHSNIYLYPLADKTLVRLTETEINGAVRGVSWSPDNQRFAYSLQKDIYLYNLENSTSRRILTLSGLIYLQQWSPDGRWLAIVSQLSDEPALGGESHRLDLYNVETNTLIPLVNKMGFSTLSWSPDSQWLAFNHDYNQGLFVVSMNDLVPIELVASNNFSFASWSPDGQWLAFTTDSGNGNLNLWNPTTQSIEQLFEGNGRLSQPIWSPDSQLLAASLNAEDESYLFVSDVNNKSTNSILTGPPPEIGPTWWPLTVLNWSPNGQWILFQALRKDKRSLSIIDLANGQSFTILDFTETTTPNHVYWLP